jgi:hypothetical protein
MSTTPIVLDQRVARLLDPEVHGVERRGLDVAALLTHVALEVRLDVRQEEQIAVARALGQLRREVAEHVQLRVERLGGAHVPLVLARPEERLAAPDVLDVVGDHAVAAEHVVLRVAEVVAHRADRAHLGEVARGQREMGRGAAERALALAERRPDRVEGDRSHDR